MDIQQLIERFQDTKENQSKAIFSTLFIIGNRLQTLFDHRIPEITLKQFMLLTMVIQSKEQLTFTQLGQLLGCSRQNIKQLALTLEKKEFVKIIQNEKDTRASTIMPTDKCFDFFGTIFVSYQEELNYFFQVYTTEEVAQLFSLMMKFYEGMDRLEKQTNEKK